MEILGALNNNLDPSKYVTQGLSLSPLKPIEGGLVPLSLAIWNYTMLYIFIVYAISYQVRTPMFYNDQTTNVTFVG